MSSSFFYFSEVSRVLNFKSLQINGYYWQFKNQRNSSGRRFCLTDNRVFFYVDEERFPLPKTTWWCQRNVRKTGI